MTEHQVYFEYLRQRSRFALLYRNYWLYPRLNKELHGHVLDVGCGVGDLLAFRPNTTGVDINPHTVAWCRSNGLDAHEMINDVLPFEDLLFQGAVLDNVLEHIADPRPLLSEISRVLVPRGVLVVGVPGKRGYAADSDHKIFYDEALLGEVFSHAGFARRRMISMPLPIPGLGRWLSQYCLYGVFVRSS